MENYLFTKHLKEFFFLIKIKCNHEIKLLTFEFNQNDLNNRILNNQCLLVLKNKIKESISKPLKDDMFIKLILYDYTLEYNTSKYIPKDSKLILEDTIIEKLQFMLDNFKL